MKTNTGCQQLTISINQVEFPAQLNTLDTPGLDAILGMDWLVKHAAQIDCASRSVTLTNPEGIRTTYLPNKPHQLKAKVFSIQTPEIGEIYVVSEYPDVFPDELSGMPPDRAGVITLCRVRDSAVDAEPMCALSQRQSWLGEEKTLGEAGGLAKPLA